MKLGPILLISCCCCNLSLLIAFVIYMQQSAKKSKEQEIEKKQEIQKSQQQVSQMKENQAKVAAKAEVAKVTEKPQPTNVKKVVHRRTNKCVDSDGSDIYGRSCGSDYQKWEYNDGILKHVQSGKCLSFNNNEQKVIISDCNENDRFQKWTQNETLIRNNVTGRCLDGDGEKIYTGYCDTKNVYQQWDVLNY